jgi:hypothetical protein
MLRRHTSGSKRVGSSNKALTNERKYPFIVELAITGEELELALSRRIIDFHNRRHIRTRHGRTVLRKWRKTLSLVLFRYSDGSRLRRTVWRGVLQTLNKLVTKDEARRIAANVAKLADGAQR